MDYEDKPTELEPIMGKPPEVDWRLVNMLREAAPWMTADWKLPWLVDYLRSGAALAIGVLDHRFRPKYLTSKAKGEFQKALLRALVKCVAENVGYFIPQVTEDDQETKEEHEAS